VQRAGAPLQAPDHGAGFQSALAVGTTTTLLPALIRNVAWHVPVQRIGASLLTFTVPEPITDTVSSTVGPAACAPVTRTTATTAAARSRRCLTD